ncbi:hypothetical protein [Undibacterium sp. Ren11W]|uniref:hypothetical protein n=1 Tax=Undibacterium sp. Ren11W TaxID=3413045 RepID=UPI003BF49D8F
MPKNTQSIFLIGTIFALIFMFQFLDAMPFWLAAIVGGYVILSIYFYIYKGIKIFFKSKK